MKHIRILTIFIILLLVSLPSTFALQIASHRAYGQDGVDGYVREDDVVTVAATLTDTGEMSAADLASHLKLGPFPFDTCSEQVDGFLCTYENPLDANGMTIFPYELTLTDRWDRQVDSESGVFYVDHEAPGISLGSAWQEGATVNLEYRATDSAYPIAPATVCSGLSEMRLTRDDGAVLGVFNLSGCDVSGVVDFASETFASSGQQRVCAQVSDHFGYNTTACTTVQIDREAPVIGQAQIVTPFVSGLAWTSAEGEDGRIQFSVDENVDLESVNLTINGAVHPVSCLSDGDRFNCSSTSYHFNPDNYSIRVIAVDAAGNIAQKSQSFVVSHDVMDPALSAFMTEFVIDEKMYLSEQSDVIARFDEAGSGFYRKEVFLRLPTNEVLQADTCVKRDQWECRWSGFDLNDLNGEGLMVLERSFDDAGNRVDGESLMQKVIVDTEAPSLDVVEFYALSGGVRVPFAYSRSPAFVEINYSDRSPSAKAQVDFSVLGGNISSVSCTDGFCRVQSGTLGVGPAAGMLLVNLTDAFGNSLLHDLAAELLHTVNESMDMWHYETRLMPDAIDRSISELTDNFVYAEVRFGTNAAADLVRAELDDCRSRSSTPPVARAQAEAAPPGEGGFVEGAQDYRGMIPGHDVSDVFTGEDSTDIQYIRDYDLVDVGISGSTVQFLKFNLKRTSYKQVDDLQLTCTFRLVSRWGDQFAPEEIEDVNITIPFFSNPAGDLGEAYKEELDSAIEDATEGIVNKIASLEKFVEIARKICEVIEGLTGIIRALNTVLGSLGIQADILRSIPIIGVPASESTNEIAWSFCEQGEGMKQGAREGFAGIIGKFCDFVSCRFSLTGWLFNNMGEDEGKFSSLESGVQNSVLGKALGGDVVLRLFKDGEVSGYTDTSESLVWSILNLCIPGIIKNLNEYRQIKCRYAVCLQDDVPAGVPRSACDSMKGYMTCKYIVGEVFSFIPLTAFFDSIFKQLKQAFSSPTGVLGFAMGTFCSMMCKPIKAKVPGSGTAASACSKLEIIKAIGDIVTYATKMFNADYWKVEGEDVCERLEEDD